jgi:hypothetical protein
VQALVYFDGDSSEATFRIELVSDITKLLYIILNTYPHDTSHLQRLEFYKEPCTKYRFKRAAPHTSEKI